MTADHGGQVGATSHHIVTDSGNFRVPVYVWGPGVAPGANLYVLSPQYTQPGLGRPNNIDPNKPIRNGDAANLALAALGSCRLFRSQR